MKIAIYSRGGETVQQADWQLLLNELNKEKVTTVIHEDFFSQIRHAPALRKNHHL